MKRNDAIGSRITPSDAATMNNPVSYIAYLFINLGNILQSFDPTIVTMNDATLIRNRPSPSIALAKL